MNTHPTTRTFVLAGGCFWCLDAAYRVMRGVTAVDSVYTGGTSEHPTYEEVCAQRSGHVEAVRVSFDPEIIPVEIILDAFFTMHDPTQLNRQGHDVGVQYRSEMFYSTPEERALFEKALDRAREWYPNEIVTNITPLEKVWMAEPHHQDFFAHNPEQAYCLAVAMPKVNKIRANFSAYINV